VCLCVCVVCLSTHVCGCVCEREIKRESARAREMIVAGMLEMHALDMTHTWMSHAQKRVSLTISVTHYCNGVATISRLLKIVGLFFRIWSLL